MPATTAPDAPGTLVDLMRKAGHDPDSLAEECGVSQATVSRWLNGVHPPKRHSHAEDLARAVAKGDTHRLRGAIALTARLADEAMPRLLCRLILTAFPAFSPSPSVAYA